MVIRNLISLHSLYWRIIRRVLRGEKECLRDRSVKLGGRKSDRYLKWIRSCGRVHFVPVPGVYGAALHLSFSSFYSRARYWICASSERTDDIAFQYRFIWLTFIRFAGISLTADRGRPSIPLWWRETGPLPIPPLARCAAPQTKAF